MGNEPFIRSSEGDREGFEEGRGNAEVAVGN